MTKQQRNTDERYASRPATRIRFVNGEAVVLDDQHRDLVETDRTIDARIRASAAQNIPDRRYQDYEFVDPAKQFADRTSPNGLAEAADSAINAVKTKIAIPGKLKQLTKLSREYNRQREEWAALNTEIGALESKMRELTVKRNQLGFGSEDLRLSEIEPLAKQLVKAGVAETEIDKAREG